MHTYTWSGCREDRKKSCEGEVLAQVIENPWPQYWKEDRASIARQSLSDQRIREKILPGVPLQGCAAGLTKMCGKKQVSLNGAHSVEKLEKLSRDGLVEELESRAPTFHAVLKMCVDV